MEGVPVGLFLMSRDSREAAFSNIGRALALIRKHAPRRFARLRRDFGGILVCVSGGYSGRWIGSLRLCELEQRSVRDKGASPVRIACTLVHEAMHARLDRLGFGYAAGKERARIEAACKRAERAFARRLPGDVHGPYAAEMVQEAEAWLRALREPDAGERYFGRAAHAEGELQAMRETGAPEWIVRALRALHRTIGRRKGFLDAPNGDG
jgi:hypothetical protein